MPSPCSIQKKLSLPKDLVKEGQPSHSLHQPQFAGLTKGDYCRRTAGDCSEKSKVIYPVGEAPPYDPHRWRKYGQKTIKGSANSRGYYRCTHKESRGCPALKHVQKSDHGPLIMEVIYIGGHTCDAEPSCPVTPSPHQEISSDSQLSVENFEIFTRFADRKCVVGDGTSITSDSDDIPSFLAEFELLGRLDDTDWSLFEFDSDGSSMGTRNHL